MKNAGAIGWSEVDSREAALIERCAAGDDVACAELVAAHQRMVYGLAFNLLGDRDEALDLSQEVFLRVFRTLSTFRGQSALRTWIYRIVINQARNRQRWWRRRHRSEQVSLEQWCEFLAERAGLEVSFEVTDATIGGVTVDTSRMAELCGPTKVAWRDGFARLADAHLASR